VDVLLDDAGAAASRCGVVDYAPDFVKLSCNLNSMPSVGIFSWFDDPNVLWRSWRLVV